MLLIKVQSTIQLLKLAAVMLSSEKTREVFGESRHIKNGFGIFTGARSDHCLQGIDENL